MGTIFYRETDIVISASHTYPLQKEFDLSNGCFSDTLNSGAFKVGRIPTKVPLYIDIWARALTAVPSNVAFWIVYVLDDSRNYYSNVKNLTAGARDFHERYNLYGPRFKIILENTDSSSDVTISALCVQVRG